MFTNWKTTAFGLAVIIITAIGPVLDHYFPLVGLSWTAIATSIAALFGGAGLISAKDSTTHSSPAQVLAKGATISASQATALGIPNAPALVEAAAVEVKAADVEAASK